MSMVYFGLPCGRSPTLSVKESRSRSRVYAVVKRQDQTLLWGKQILPYFSYSIKGLQRGVKSKRNFIVYNAVQPGGGAPMPTEPPFNFFNWIMGVIVTVVLPFVTHKWTSLLKIRGEVEDAVQKIEDIVDAVEKVAHEVEKVAEDIAEDLPEGGKLRKAVDFVEHIAERASDDARAVSDLIDKVQELDEKVEEYAEALVEEAAHHQLKDFNQPPQLTNEVYQPPELANEFHKPLEVTSEVYVAPQPANEFHESLVVMEVCEPPQVVNEACEARE